MGTGFFSWNERSRNNLFEGECGYKNSASYQKNGYL